MNRIAAAAALLLATTVTTVPAHAASLTDALIQAYQNSIPLQIARAGLRASDEGVAQAFSATRPSVSGSFSHSYSGVIDTFLQQSATTTIAINASLTLWDGGGTRLGIEAAQASVAASRAALVNTEQQVLLGAVVAFMDMRRDIQFVSLGENNVSVTEQEVQASRDRFEVGEITRTDVSLAEARLAGAYSELAARQGGLEISREIYNSAIGVYPDSLQSPPLAPKIPSTVAAAKAVAMRSHPSITQAQNLAKLAEISVARAEAAMKPRVTVGGGVTVGKQMDIVATGGSLQLGATVPIYQGGRLVSVMRQAVANKERAQADVQRTAQMVSQNVARSWAQLQIATATITARDQQVRASTVAHRGVREEARQGARTTLDVLNAERELRNAQSNLLAAKRDEYVAVYSLLSSMGLLTVKHLQLGINTYDVDAYSNAVKSAPTKTERSKILQSIFKRAGHE